MYGGYCPDVKAALIGVDWGMTSFQAMRLDRDGIILDHMETGDGVLCVTPGEFPARLDALIGPWLKDAPFTPVVISGMAGGRDGWLDTGYLDCPLPLRTVRGHMMTAPQRGVYIVPGLRVSGDRLRAPDVMRGEVTRLLGLDAPDSACVCLPGLHSKWVWLKGEQVHRFSTAVTGEVFNALRPRGEDGPIDRQTLDTNAFDSGVAASGKRGGLLHQLFAGQTLPEAGKLSNDNVGAYLYGLLVGHEIRGLAPRGAIILVGEPATTQLYARALTSLGRKPTEVDGVEAAARGLARMLR